MSEYCAMCGKEATTQTGLCYSCESLVKSECPNCGACCFDPNDKSGCPACGYGEQE